MHYTCQFSASLVLAAAVLVGALPASGGQQQTAPFIVKPSDDKLTSLTAGIALDLPNGNRLRFVEIRDGKDRLHGYGVGEYVRRGNLGVNDIDRLRGVDPLTLFHAVSEPRTPVPRDMLRVYGQPRTGDRQGWARDALLAGGTAAGGADSCAEDLFPFQSFVNDVQSYGYPLLFLSEDDGPNSKPQHWFGMGFVYQYDKLTGAAYDVSRFYTRVVYCDRDEESNEYPWVTVKYRKYNFWANADAVQVFNVGDELSFWWDPEQSPIDPSFDDTGFEIDFKLVIDYGYEDDKFWIGATWSKPFDTLTWGY